MIITAATSQLKALIKIYSTYLPIKTLPYIPFVISAIFQVLAWFGGTHLLGNYTIIPRVIFLWFFALGEYAFMSPAMNAAVEVLGKDESFLIVVYQIITLVVFIVMNLCVFRRPFHLKYALSFALLALAIYVAHT